MKSIKKFLLVAAACVAVLGFVSCASDDDSGSSSDPAIAIFEYESGYVWTSTETIADGVLKYSVDHKSYKRTK